MPFAAPPPDVLVKIEGPGINTGLVMCGDRCVATTRRLRWCLGKSTAEVRGYIAAIPGWKATIVKRHPDRRWRPR